MINSIKIFNVISRRNFAFLLGSILLGIPAVMLSDFTIFLVPFFLLIILSFIYGERFVIALVLITLFTLVGEFNRSLRTVIQLTDFAILGYLFLKKFGLDFSNYRQVPKSILYFLILYFSSMIISSAMSEYTFAGIKTITMQFAFFIIVYVFYSLIDEVSDIKNYFLSITLVACILVTIALITFFLEGYSLINIISKDRARVSVLISNFEAFSNYFVISVPILISLLLVKNRTHTKKINWFLLFYISLGLTLTMSRSAILGIIVSTAIVFFILRRRRFYQFIIIMIFIVLFFILYPPLNEFASLLLRIEEGMSARDYLWSMSINMIKDYPVFGIGPGAYPHELYNYYPFMLDDFYGQVFIYFAEVSEGVNLAHNIFLVFFVDMGLLGFATIITLPVLYFIIGLKVIKRYQNDSNYNLIIGIFAAGVSIIFRNIFNSIGLLYIGGIHTDLPFWLIFSSLIYFFRIPITENSLEKKHPHFVANSKNES